MERCYIPAIILFILALVLAIQAWFQISSSAPAALYWTVPISFGSVPLFFGILCWVLCKKGYKKLAWITPFGGVIILAVTHSLMLFGQSPK